VAELVNLENFLSDTSLAFRAACNGAVSPEARPIRRRVVGRLSRAEETRPLVNHILAALPPDLLDDYDFAVQLAKNAAWQTLVAEKVEEERRWQDLVRGPLPGKVNEWLESLFHKATEGGRPLIKAIPAVLGTVAGLAAANWLHIPLKIDPIVSGGELKFHIGADSEQKPIQFQLQASKSPIPIDVTTRSADQSPIQALENISRQLNNGNRSLSQVQNQLASIATNPSFKDIGGTRDAVVALSKQLGAESKNLDGITQELKGLSSNYSGETEKQIKIAEGQKQAFEQEIPIAYRALQRTAIPVSLAAGSSQAIAIQTFDPSTGKVSSTSVVFSFARLKQNVAEITVHGAGPPAFNDLYDLAEGQSTTINDISYKVTLNEIQRYWVFSHKVELSLTPEFAPFPNPAPGSSMTASR